MKKKYLMVANWKMNMSFQQIAEFSSTALNALEKKLTTSPISLVICPSHESLYFLRLFTQVTSIALGAQDCSTHIAGNFTGEVSAKSLQELGCSFCIVGHGERRRFHNEGEQDLYDKLLHLFAYNVAPIFCIGETKEDYEQKNSISILKQQLSVPMSVLTSLAQKPTVPLVIAYEPQWAIGSGLVPDKNHLEMVFASLHKETIMLYPGYTWKLLYGGSVDETNISKLQSIHLIDGFLVGKASTHLQQLESMIEHISKHPHLNEA